MVRYLNKALIQGFLILLLSTLLMVVAHLKFDRGFEWQVGSIGILLFILVNQFLGFFSDNWLKYTCMSFLILVALTLDLMILSTLFSGISWNEISSNARIFILPLLSFPLAVGICGGIKYYLKNKS